ncbi:MAG: glycine cleavage system protein H [Verrucomicrobiaceae bacterium]|nr:glycine cleavage system protein H [Verrucomicrobiaceae bacterium]
MSAAEDEPDLWRVGFTKFATRMLGELVEAQWQVSAGELIAPGQQIGWVEGFKAASDVFNVVNGEFVGGNPVLDVDACIVRSSPYMEGWLYEVKGNPEDGSLDIDGYIALLQATISKMQESGDYD